MLRKKRFFQAKANMQKKNQSPCAKKFYHTGLTSGAPPSPEFIRLKRPVHNTP